MNMKWIWTGWLYAFLAGTGIIAISFQNAGAQEESTAVEKGVDVLAHGPIHEAFAETVAYDPEPGIVVPKAPPEPINEIPPSQKPAGDPEWIPGYWAWDDDRSDFVWVSGTWRIVPPDRQWIPGYWAKSENGYQWISGYWAAEAVSETEYLPEPPESVEVGPNIPAPSANYGWMPGCWTWSHGRYVWRPGYWAVMRPDWVWVPAHYLWTPRGYIFVGGYWDYAVGHRGVLFAPVGFGINFAFGPGFYFTPSFMIDLRVFSDCLFLRPRYHHYYFGDYYAPRYYHRGIFPWFSPHARRHGYDPIYAHQRWRHRHDKKWEPNVHARYQERVKHEEARPPRTLYDSKRLQQKALTSKGSGRSFTPPFVPVTNHGEKIAKFKPLSKNELKRYEQRGEEVRRFSNERSRWESQAAEKRKGEASSRIETRRVEIPKSPISARSAGTEPLKKAMPERSKTQPDHSIGSQQKRPPEATRPPRQIETESKTAPSSQGVSKPYSGSSHSTRSVPVKKTPPARYKAPETDPTVQPLQRKNAAGAGGSSGKEIEKRGNPSDRNGSTPSRVDSPARHDAPQSLPRVDQPKNRSHEGRSDSTGPRSNGRGNKP